MCQVPLVLDKSFLRSVPTKRLQDISKFHKILISDALTYEVAKDVDKTRAQLFSKLDAIKDEIEYIPIIGELIRFEQENCQASKRPSQGTLARNYSLISRLADCSNQLSSKQQNAVENYKFTSSDIHSSILDVIGSYFSEYSQRFAESKYKKLLDGEIRDTKFINSVIATERKNGALVPNVALFCGEWLTFRYFQVYQLFLFDIRSVIKVSMSFWVTQKWRKKFITIFTI